MTAIEALTALALTLPVQEAPQLGTTLEPGDTVAATPFGRYDASALHRWVMGDGYRALWGRSVRAPVLDPERFAGGLTLEGMGGGLQTRSLIFRGGDGREWRFRSIDKDAARTLDPALRRTLAARILQDQIAHLFPLGAGLAHPLLEAAGVLHAAPTLVVLPDHAALGEHRAEFRGMLGWMEVRPDEGEEGMPGFAASSRVVSSDRLLERLEEDEGNRIDARSYLRARLVDALLGDWDRHPDQWRWAGFESDGHLVFEPIPRDRDWAFSRLDGLVSHFTWIPWPNYVGFRRDYPPAFRLMWSGRALDRRLLSGLGWSEWEAEVRHLVERLDDRVIERALARLPDDYPAETRDFFQDALRNRRDDLPRFGREFYELLAGWVDVYTTDADEMADARWLPDGRLRIEVREGDHPLFARTFLPAETHEVRLHMRGGDDQVEVTGTPSSRILLRVVGGGGDDRVVAASGGRRIRVYDDRGDNELDGSGLLLDEEEWDDPVDPEDNTHRAGTRDWGSRTLALPLFGYDSDLGFRTGVTLERRSYGFRQAPYRTRLAATAAWASGTGRPDLVLSGDRPVGDRRDLRVAGRMQLFGTEFHRFYGYGNGSSDADDRGSDFYAAPRDVVGLEAELVWRPAEDWSLHLGSGFRGHRPHGDDPTLLDELEPYGTGPFDQLHLSLGLELDRLDDGGVAGRGFGARLAVEYAPTLFDVEDAFATVDARMELRASTDDDTALRPGIALVAGGRHVEGRFPFQAAAYLGGPETLRGTRTERWAGRSMVHAGVEARVFLSELVLLLPGDLGLLATAETGRVFSTGEEASTWHSALGAGVWLSFLDTFRMALTAARGDEETLVYLTVGLPF